jgi:hypothetical protein
VSGKFSGKITKKLRTRHQLGVFYMQTMSLELSAVSKIMYLREGDINEGEEDKVARFEKKMFEWQRDVVEKNASSSETRKHTKEELSDAIFQLEHGFGGYWCQGEECACPRSHWVVHESDTNCWDCMHDPCACNPPLVWDEKESAYYSFFLSSDGKTQKNTWMSEPTSDLMKIRFLRKTKKRKERQFETMEKDFPLRELSDNQARKKGFCCASHAAEDEAKQKRDVKKREGEAREIHGPGFCSHCEEDSCVFVQSERDITENDAIYYDAAEHAENPVAVNSARRKRAYQFTAHLLWEGINYRRQHYPCVEAGVRALFPPQDGKIMGYKDE